MQAMNDVRRMTLRLATISRVDENPGTKNPDDCKLIGIFIYPVLTDHRDDGFLP